METPMTEPELIDEIIKFNNDANVQRLQNLYNNPTFLDILAIGRRELSHSAFLAWLFNTAANHGLGATPILQLLELIVRCSHEQHKEMDGVLRNAILSRSIAIYNTIVSTEYNVKTQTAKGRADIVIDVRVGIPDANISKLRVVIENKVYSKEHSCQTNTYFEYYDKEKQLGEYILYVYLTPLLMQYKASCDKFVHLTYQDLLNNVFEPLLLLPDLSERTRFILTEYINCLSIPVEEFQDNKKNIKQTTIMAISENERSLLKAFWEKNQQLIIAAANAISTDPNSEPEEREAAENVVEMFKKDYSKYSVNGKGSYGKGPLVKQVVECYLALHPNLTVEELKEIFPDNLQGAGLGVVRSNTDKIKDKIRYKESKHPKTGEVFYVCSQWYKNKDRDNFQKFRNYVEEHIPEIKITQI